MPKFSIIIPVYNVEKYIKKCLDSISSQSFKDYEVIIVNDGTKDNSIEIAKKYNFKIVNQENKGLSEARNTGVKNSSGEYLLFLDSDDYIEKDLLLEISKVLDNGPDVVRFQLKQVWENSDKEVCYKEESFYGKNGVDAFNLIVNYEFVEPAWAYVFKKSYYLKNKFSFKRGLVHEDFGLIPLAIIKANIVNSISYVGYCYLQREGSIMSSNSYEKVKKKVDDLYLHYDYLMKELNNFNGDTRVIKSFISNSLILKTLELNEKDYKKYLKQLRKDGVFNNLLDDTFSRKVKKIIVKMNPKLFFKRR
ncbi:MAG: glycosyltransferase [Bacilli bacterium]|nr:glycosyltransferase [Bacilli bacterium]